MRAMTNRLTSRIWVQALLLVFIGGLIGAVVNALRPEHGIPWLEEWSLRVESRTLQEGFDVVSVSQGYDALQAGSHWFVDARSADEYFAGTIPGALSLPLRAVDEAFPDVQMMVLPEEPVIAFCSSAICDEALLLALFLREQGWTNVAVMVAGIDAWADAGHPMEGAP